MAASTAILVGSGYQQIAGRFSNWDGPTSRLFEDPCNIVGVGVFDTCDDLLRGWTTLQESLVGVISREVGEGEAKASDGYLVLLTPALAASHEEQVETVRYDTTRLRKLVATGQDLRSVVDVERYLRGLLPLRQEHAELSAESALDMLPALLCKEGIPADTTGELVRAFRAQAPLLERLHELEPQE